MSFEASFSCFVNLCCVLSKAIISFHMRSSHDPKEHCIAYYRNIQIQACLINLYTSSMIMHVGISHWLGGIRCVCNENMNCEWEHMHSVMWTEIIMFWTMLTSHESPNTPGKIITFWRQKITQGKKLLLPLPCWLVHQKGRHIIPTRGRAAARASFYLLRRQQMTTRLADIRNWPRKQVPGPLGPALCWRHSPKLMSGMQSTALTKLWLWRRPWSQNRGKVYDWPAEKK